MKRHLLAPGCLSLGLQVEEQECRGHISTSKHARVFCGAAGRAWPSPYVIKLPPKQGRHVHAACWESCLTHCALNVEYLQTEATRAILTAAFPIPSNVSWLKVSCLCYGTMLIGPCWCTPAW